MSSFLQAEARGLTPEARVAAADLFLWQEEAGSTFSMPGHLVATLRVGASAPLQEVVDDHMPGVYTAKQRLLARLGEWKQPRQC